MRPRYVLMPAALLLVAGGVYFWLANSWYSGDASATPETMSAEPANPAPAARRGGREQKFDTRKHLFNPDVVQVTVAPVRQTDFPIYLSGLGTVYAYNTVDTMAQVDGVIQQMKFVEGQDVKIGDPLVILDATPYQAKVEQFQGLKAKAEAALVNAKSNLWRDQQLLSHNFVSQKVTDSEQALVDQYTAELAEYGAEIKYWQAQVDFTLIRSPINGRTGIRHVDPGNLIRAQQHVNIVTVTQMQPISVIITLPSKLLAETGNRRVSAACRCWPIRKTAARYLTVASWLRSTTRSMLRPARSSSRRNFPTPSTNCGPAITSIAASRWIRAKVRLPFRSLQSGTGRMAISSGW